MMSQIQCPHDPKGLLITKNVTVNRRLRDCNMKRTVKEISLKGSIAAEVRVSCYINEI